MGQDITGFQAALATIPEGQLSERQARIAAAVAMVRQGCSAVKAAREARIPRSTLRDYLCRVADVAMTQEQETRTAALLDTSYDIANLAAEAITRSIAETPEDWKPGDLVKAYGVATDKTINLAKPAQSSSPGVSALAQLLEAGDLTLTKRDASRDAIDVTPEASE